MLPYVFEEFKSVSRPLRSDEDLEPLLDHIGDSRVVMLGESSHGTEEFYEQRRIVSQRLIERYGFKFIAVEGDWPDCFRINQYINGKGDEELGEVMRNFRRWPTWMWANVQTAELAAWLKGTGTGFYGLDVYSLFESLDAINSYAGRLTKESAEKLAEVDSCFKAYDRDEIAYAKAVIQWPNGCEDRIAEFLREILRVRLQDTSIRYEELFDIKQNAKIIQNAEKYYRSMLDGGPESWNVRDHHMMDTLDSLLRFHGESAKGIVWAHNTHIGDYHATDMVNDGYVNLGGLARERYGAENVSLVGFGTHSGTVMAGKAWGAKPEVMRLPEAVKGSYEDYFHRVSEVLNLDGLFVLLPAAESLSFPRGHRAVGVVYQSRDEHKRNYVPTRMNDRYDAFVFIDKTKAVRALPGVAEPGVFPETWPAGV